MYEHEACFDCPARPVVDHRDRGRISRSVRCSCTCERGFGVGGADYGRVRFGALESSSDGAGSRRPRRVPSGDSICAARTRHTRGIWSGGRHFHGSRARDGARSIIMGWMRGAWGARLRARRNGRRPSRHTRGNRRRCRSGTSRCVSISGPGRRGEGLFGSAPAGAERRAGIGVGMNTRCRGTTPRF